MAEAKPTTIRPFPETIDREYFGAWLSGFADGEGCFWLGQSEHGSPLAFFRIELRRDDADILYLIQSYLECGRIDFKKLYPHMTRRCANAKPQVLYRTVNVGELPRIVAHFDRYPLFAKKKRDFAVWKSAVELMCEVSLRRRVRRSGRGGGFTPKWRPDEVARFVEWKNELRRGRAFPGDAPNLGVQRPVRPPEYFPLFDSREAS